MDNQTILTVLLWGLGTCITGFMFLVGWVIKLNIDLKDRVTFSWVEDQLKKDIQKDIGVLQENFNKLDNKIVTQINEIKEALIGTVDKKGILNKIHEHEDRLNFLEK